MFDYFPERKLTPKQLAMIERRHFVNFARQIDYWQKYQNKIQGRDVQHFSIALREMGMSGLWARYNIPMWPGFKRIGNYNVTYDPPIGDVIETLLVDRCE